MTRIRRCVVELAAALAGLLGLAALVAVLLGVRAVPVLTGSMRPTIPVGGLVLTTRQPPASVTAGQILVFRAPAPFVTVDGRPVVHRVVAVSPRSHNPGFTTRGDANPTTDPWRVALTPDAQLGRVRFVAPRLGRLVAGGRGTSLPVAGGLLLLTVAAQLRRRPLSCGCL